MPHKEDRRREGLRRRRFKVLAKSRSLVRYLRRSTEAGEKEVTEKDWTQERSTATDRVINRAINRA